MAHTEEEAQVPTVPEEIQASPQRTTQAQGQVALAEQVAQGRSRSSGGPTAMHRSRHSTHQRLGHVLQAPMRCSSTASAAVEEEQADRGTSAGIPVAAEVEEVH